MIIKTVGFSFNKEDQIHILLAQEYKISIYQR